MPGKFPSLPALLSASSAAPRREEHNRAHIVAPADTLCPRRERRGVREVLTPEVGCVREDVRCWLATNDVPNN